jgi:SAM-dependent methyltransferase
MKRCLRCERRFEAETWRCPGCGFAPQTVDGRLAFAAGLEARDIGFDPARFAVMAEAEREHFWFRSRAKLILWALRRHFPGARTLLEIGCGTGNVLAALAADSALSRLVGTEAHLQGLAFAARRAPQAELLQLDARRIPYRDEFDVVGAFDVIEHIDEDDAVLREMFAACRPGGGVIVTVPQHPWLWSYRDEFARHRRRYTRRELLGGVAAAGFVDLWASSFVSLLLPVMALSRLRQRRPERFDASGELRVGPGINRVLGVMLTLERGLIAAGMRLPFGGSLIAVGRKP